MTTKGLIPVDDIITNSPLFTKKWKEKYRREVRERMEREGIKL